MCYSSAWKKKSIKLNYISCWCFYYVFFFSFIVKYYFTWYIYWIILQHIVNSNNINTQMLQNVTNSINALTQQTSQLQVTTNDL